MKTPLKVGDRAIWKYWDRSLTVYSEIKGTITEIRLGSIEILSDDNELEIVCAPRSVRRLKPKRKLREWRVTGFDGMTEFKMLGQPLKPGETIIVREVPARKGEK